MSGRFGDQRVVDLAEATAELRARRRASGEKRHEDRRRKRSVKRFNSPLTRTALWVVVFYAALAVCTALWWHSDVVGLPRLLMGSLLLLFVLLGTAREAVETYPIAILFVPAGIVIAAFFYYPLAPTAVILSLVFIVGVLCSFWS